MRSWPLPTLSKVLAFHDIGTQAAFSDSDGHVATVSLFGLEGNPSPSVAQQQLKAERDWCGAIAALNQMLQTATDQISGNGSGKRAHAAIAEQGLVLSGPSSVLSHEELLNHFASGVFTPQSLDGFAWVPFQLPPALEKTEKNAVPAQKTTLTLPLLPGDPVGAEQFCLVLTAHFSLVMVLGEDEAGTPACLWSFDPDVVEQAWQALRPRILLTSPQQIRQIDRLVEQFPPLAPSYKTVTQFGRLQLQHLPDYADLKPEPHSSAKSATETIHSGKQPTPETWTATDEPNSVEHEVLVDGQAKPDGDDKTSFDVELLQAIAHEVRTPLTTIRTLTRLLLKRKDLAPEVIKRLEIIDRECNEQIDRFGLIFRAAELETSTVKRSPVALASTSLDQLLQQSIPRWQQQATQRNLTLDVVTPQKMPTVVSDPTMLDQALTSLIERFTRSLPAGSHIQVQVTLAGNQLKLQFQSNAQAEDSKKSQACSHSPLKSVGQLLMFQPETGSLSLSLGVTKNLFQALGGKLIVRQRPQQGEVMTIFLPLEMSHF